MPRKNILNLGGKPLIAWTIEAAEQAELIDEVIVSTEDEEIASLAIEWGGKVPFLRPTEFATDDASVMDVVRHCVEQFPGSQWAMLLQPTSPLRTHHDIDGMIRRCQEEGAPSAVSVCEMGKHPRWAFHLRNNGRLSPCIRTPLSARRQELEKAYLLNGAMYLARTGWLDDQPHFVGADTLGYVMPPERSVDIDCLLDLQYAEFLISKNQPQ